VQRTDLEQKNSSDRTIDSIPSGNTRDEGQAKSKEVRNFSSSWKKEGSIEQEKTDEVKDGKQPLTSPSQSMWGKRKELEGKAISTPWSGSFEDPEKQNKFLKLLGAKKNTTVVERKDAKVNNELVNKSEKLLKDLEEDYNRSMEYQRGSMYGKQGLK